MRKETIRTVMFHSPGSFTSNDWTVVTDATRPEDVKWDKWAYMFEFHEREDIVDGDKRYRGESKQIGPRYYHPKSRVETLAQAKKNPNFSTILIRNMESNGWTHIVWSRWGNWPQPFDPATSKVLGQ